MECVMNFGFFEKLHEPIFIVHRLGHIVKMNQAARRLLSFAKVGALEVENFAKFRALNLIVSDTKRTCQRVHLGKRAYQAISRYFKGPDFVLIELTK